MSSPSAHRLPHRVGLTVAALAVATAAPARARADRYEASIAGELHAGVARVGEAGAPTTASVPALGVAGRLTHAWHNRLAWDVQLGAALTQPATFTDVVTTVGGRPEMGTVTRRAITTAAQLGAELRLGARFIPTVRLGLGPQLRYRTGSDLGALPDVLPAATSIDALVSVAVGFDLRIGRRLVIGAALQLDHAQPLGDAPAHDVIGVTVRVSDFFYPRWWSPSW
jgi:hypothetical protein